MVSLYVAAELTAELACMLTLNHLFSLPDKTSQNYLQSWKILLKVFSQCSETDKIRFFYYYFSIS